MEETVRDAGGELLAIAREMVRIPAGLYMRAAELAGGVVLTVWLVLWPLLVRAWRLAGRLLRLGEREVSPARATLAAAAAAAVMLAIAQFADYSSVSIGTPEYGDVESIAPAPAVDAEPAGSAHLWLGIPLALAALAAIWRAGRGRASSAWALVPIGLVTVLISLAIDVPAGLDEGDVALAYEGAEAHLLGGFWVQLACGVVLTLLAPVLVRALNQRGGRAAARSRRRERATRARPRREGRLTEARASRPAEARA